MVTETGNEKSIKELFVIFWVFFKIGLFTIGGGLVMVPIMHREFVDKRGWVDKEAISDIFSIAQALPGVIALNSSVYIGYLLHGLKGALLAAAGMTIPPFACILIIYYTLQSITGDAAVYIERFCQGVRCAVIALIALTLFKLARESIKDFFGVFIALLGVVMTIVLKVDMPYVILSCGFLGYIYYSVIIMRFKRGE